MEDNFYTYIALAHIIIVMVTTVILLPILYRLYITWAVLFETAKANRRQREREALLRKNPEMATEKGLMLRLAKACYEDQCRIADGAVRIGEWDAALAAGMKQYYLEEYQKHIEEINKKYN